MSKTLIKYWTNFAKSAGSPNSQVEQNKKCTTYSNKNADYAAWCWRSGKLGNKAREKGWHWL